MSAQIIADDILKIAKRKGKNLTPMQLMKLVYVSYGWYLAMTNNKLFEDRIEAWKYGPVIPNLYHATKHFGSGEIPASMISDAPISNSHLDIFLSSIVDNYADYSGIALSNLTHRVGTPWQAVYRPNVMGIEIPDHSIQQHYSQALNDRQESTAAAS